MGDQRAFHLGVCRRDLQGAELAIVPGDPERVRRIGELLDSAVELTRQREFTSWYGELEGKPLVVCSTGIGGPSTSIAVEELAQCGVRTFLRAGTTGAIQPHINVADVIVSTGAVRLDGASLHFAPMEFPAVADFACSQALVSAARKHEIPCVTGITASSDTFYPGQERYDTFSGRVTRQFRGSMKEWQSMGVLNYEMEAATLLTMCASLGLRAGCVAGVIVNRTHTESPDEARIASVESNAIAVAVEAARLLLNA
ncbi:uridine phosphorylase [Candidatus Sororendozoicomonas aggregata]|uniref:uridine phosphorylase n=1 Tax=Candidatus Sororendozoicomonas aggregata TaxID=3073239 RepID=UPI002ED48129